MKINYIKFKKYNKNNKYKICNEWLKQKFFIKHEACSEAMEWMEKDKITTEAQVWAKCNRGDWMIWTLRKAGKMDKPTSVRIAIECAKHVLKIFEKKYPKDKRPRKAIEAASAWLENPSEKTRADAADAAAAYAAVDARSKERKWQANMLRRVLGNPFKKGTPHDK